MGIVCLYYFPVLGGYFYRKYDFRINDLSSLSISYYNSLTSPDFVDETVFFKVQPAFFMAYIIPICLIGSFYLAFHFGSACVYTPLKFF